MKLPGIDYRTAVGPDVSGLPLQTARAWSNAGAAWSDTITKISDELAITDGNNAAMAGIRQLEDSELNLRLNTTWDVASMGEIPSNVRVPTRDRLGPQAQYPVHEFAGDYYDHQTKRVIEEQTKNLSGKAKRIAIQQITDHSRKRRVYVLNDQFDKKKDYGKGSALNAINTANSMATFETLEDTVLANNRTIAGALKSGFIDQVEAETLMRNSLEEATLSAVIDKARRADSPETLETLERDVLTQTVDGMPARMSSDKLEKALRFIDAQKKVIDEQLDEMHDENFRGAINGIRQGVLSKDGVLAFLSINEINPTQAKFLMSLLDEAKPTAITYKDESARNYWSGQISRMRFGIGEEETLRMRYERMQKDINAAASGHYDNGTPYQGVPITGTDAAWALDKLDQQYEKILSHPELKQVFAYIRVATGTDGMIDIDKTSNNGRALLAFNRAAWNYYDRMGADANMLQWFEENKAAYDPENFSAGMERSRLRNYGVPQAVLEGQFDARKVAAWLETQTDISPERRRAIQETLLPIDLVAPDASMELQNNTIDASTLTEKD